MLFSFLSAASFPITVDTDDPRYAFKVGKWRALVKLPAIDLHVADRAQLALDIGRGALDVGLVYVHVLRQLRVAGPGAVGGNHRVVESESTLALGSEGDSKVLDLGCGIVETDDCETVLAAAAAAAAATAVEIIRGCRDGPLLSLG